MRDKQQAKTRSERTLRIVCSSSFLLSLLLLGALAYRRPSEVGFLLDAYGVFIVLVQFLIPFLQRNGMPVGWFVSLATLNLLIGVPELLLRLVDFRHEAGVQFGYPRPTVFRRLDPDPQLFWRYDRDDPGVNSWGFRGREVVTEKKPGTIRVLFLGDSCTEQGYPSIAEALVNGACRTSCYECVNLGMSGYTSFQGMRVAAMFGERVRPDLVFVYFGWNDHWLAFGARDAEKKIPIPNPRITRIYHEVVKTRLVQFAQHLVCAALGKQQGPLSITRVPPADYEQNLKAIHRAFATNGIPVVFVTAPTSHPALGVPDDLVSIHLVESKDSCIRLHRQYNEIVRRVQRGLPRSFLCDLDARYARYSPDEMRAIFMPDGIHFTEQGRAVVARDICQVMESIPR